MSITKLLLWVGEKALGPVGDVIGAASALLDNDQRDGTSRLVEETTKRLHETHAQIDMNEPRQIQDYTERGRQALRNIRNNREATLDYLAAQEARALESGNLSGVKEIRRLREEYIRNNREMEAEVYTCYKDNTGHELQE